MCGARALNRYVPRVRQSRRPGLVNNAHRPRAVGFTGNWGRGRWGVGPWEPWVSAGGAVWVGWPGVIVITNECINQLGNNQLTIGRNTNGMNEYVNQITVK